MRTSKLYVEKHYKIKTDSELGITEYTTMNPYGLHTLLKQSKHLKLSKKHFHFYLITCLTKALIFQSAVWPKRKHHLYLLLTSRILIWFSRLPWVKFNLPLQAQTLCFYSKSPLDWAASIT